MRALNTGRKSVADSVAWSQVHPAIQQGLAKCGLWDLQLSCNIAQ